MDGATGFQIQGFSSSRQVLQEDRKRLQVSGPGCQKGTEVVGNPKAAENSACSGSNAEEEVEAQAEAEERPFQESSPGGQVCTRLLGIHNSSILKDKTLEMVRSWFPRGRLANSSPSGMWDQQLSPPTAALAKNPPQAQQMSHHLCFGVGGRAETHLAVLDREVTPSCHSQSSEKQQNQ